MEQTVRLFQRQQWISLAEPGKSDYHYYKFCKKPYGGGVSRDT
jgi:hypothetical protein